MSSTYIGLNSEALSPHELSLRLNHSKTHFGYKVLGPHVMLSTLKYPTFFEEMTWFSLLILDDPHLMI